MKSLDDELMEEYPNAEKIRTYLDMIQRNSDRLENYVTDILNYQKTGAVETREKKEWLDVSELARGAINSWPEATQRVHVQTEGDTRILAVKEGIHQIFSNLLSNSLKHAPTGDINIRIEKKGANLHVSITDHGPGIPPHLLSEIFHPFTTAKQNQSKKNTGLGLSIAHKWVNNHGGHIWAESPVHPSSDAPGTTFHFTLPVE